MRASSPSLLPAVGAGLLTAMCLQGRANGFLGSVLGHAVFAALISFVSGLLVVSAVLLCSARSPTATVTLLRLLRTQTMPWWMLVGDGLDVAARRCRRAGDSGRASFASSGCSWSSPHGSTALTSGSVWACPCGRRCCPSSPAASPPPSRPATAGSGPRQERQWWILLGGALGVVFIAITALTVARLGVLLLSLFSLFGNLAGALLLDRRLPIPGSLVRRTTVLSALGVLAGIVITLMPAAGSPPARVFRT